MYLVTVVYHGRVNRHRMSPKRLLTYCWGHPWLLQTGELYVDAKPA